MVSNGSYLFKTPNIFVNKNVTYFRMIKKHIHIHIRIKNNISNGKQCILPPLKPKTKLFAILFFTSL